MFKIKKLIGSSETTRAACFKYYSSFAGINTKQNKKNLNSKIHFSFWLAGLIDGDGYLGTSLKGYTSCEITLSLNEVSLLYRIKKVLGGRVLVRNKQKAYRWRLHHKKSMLFLLTFINGKLRTASKKKQLNNVCEQLGVATKQKKTMERPQETQNHEVDFHVEYNENKKQEAFEAFSCDSYKGFENYWLAGFFEAEGCFHVNSFTFQCSIQISQKNPEICNDIKDFFGGFVFYDKSWNGYLYASSSKQSLEKWFLYFSKYPLKGPKAIDLVRFKRICLFKERKYHLDLPFKNSQPTKNSQKRFLNIVKLFKSRQKSPKL